MAGFQVYAESKYVPGSPIKARRVVNVVRGMYAEEALEVLYGLCRKQRPGPLPRPSRAPWPTRKRTLVFRERI